VEFTAGSGGIDVWYTSMHVEKRRFWRSGWYLDVRKFLNDPTMTAPDYDWNDMAAGAKSIATQPDGSISGMPAFVDPWILFYRKDLFAQKGLKPPKTLAEMEEFPEVSQRAEPLRLCGPRPEERQCPAWDWCSSAWRELPDQGRQGLRQHARGGEGDGLLRRDAAPLRPPGVVNFNWYGVQFAFMQGQVAMYFDG